MYKSIIEPTIVNTIFEKSWVNRDDWFLHGKAKGGKIIEDWWNLDGWFATSFINEKTLGFLMMIDDTQEMKSSTIQTLATKPKMGS